MLAKTVETRYSFTQSCHK